LKKSKMMVEKFITDFDRKLNELFNSKCNMDKLITSYEIYSLRLLMNVYNEENLPFKIGKLEEKLKNLEKQLQEMPDERELLVSAESREDRKPAKEDKKDQAFSSIKELAKQWQEDTKDLRNQNTQNKFQLDLN